MFAPKRTKTNRPNKSKATLTASDVLLMVRHFGRNEDGVMTVFAIMMLLMMLMVGGIGVDLMRNEMERVRLQNTIDRAVLAAADLDQTLDPTAVVNDYFDKSGMSTYLSSVTVDQGLNYRTVNATANTVTPTRFMRLVGVDELGVPARSTAEERISNVEISLVLDISGSMGSNNKMSNLKTAAKTFVDQVIREETEDLISVSLVPYTAQVNAGPNIFNQMKAGVVINGSPNQYYVHPFSQCIDFEPSDFNAAGLTLSKTYEQSQHFNYYAPYKSSNGISNPGCPQQSYERIVPFSQNASSLKSTIDSYTDRHNTAIHLGMKWGVAMLDPSFRPINQGMANLGQIDAIFGARPANYSDPETLKTIILMTDGKNVTTRRIHPAYYANANHWAHWDIYSPKNYADRKNFWWYNKYSISQANSMLSNVCTAAKAQGIVIWSVGFEVTTSSAAIMEACASSPSHFFRVEGVEITEAFSAIASQINQLRLTQ